MTGLLLPRGSWGKTKPPVGVQLDRGHPLAPNILGAWTFSEGGGGLVLDSVSGRLAAASGGPTWTQGTTGPAMLFDDTDDYIPTHDIDTPYISILARARADGSAGAGGGVIVSKNYDGVSVPFVLNTRYVPVIQGFAFYDGNWSNAGVTEYVEGTGWRDYAGTFDGVNLRFHVDSIQQSLTTVSARTLPTANNNTVDIGRYLNNSYYFLGAIEYVYILNRALSTEEIRAFHANPYAPFAPPVWRRYFIPAGAGGPEERSVDGTMGAPSGALARTLAALRAPSGTMGEPSGTLAASLLEPPQIARPVADVAAGSWANEAGNQTDLYASIDESTASDADYIQSSLSPSTDLTKIRLAALTDPAASTDHVVRYRYGKDASGGDQIDLVVRLYAADGTTVIATNTHTNIGSTLTDGSFTLTGGEADAIPGADYSTGLVLGFQANRP